MGAEGTVWGHMWGLVLPSSRASTKEQLLPRKGGCGRPLGKVVMDWDQSIPPCGLWPSQSTARERGQSTEHRGGSLVP